MSAALRNRNRMTALASLAIIAGMGTMVYYAVPLYRLFCQVTGYGGTTQQASGAPGAAGDRVITVRFDADVSARLPWSFRPVVKLLRVRVGEEALTYYEARNKGRAAATGSALYNVSPAKAGRYFSKIECFCFEEQRLEAGQRVEMSVAFYIDPAILDDRNLDDVATITLSYTLYRVSQANEEPETHTLTAVPADDRTGPKPARQAPNTRRPAAM